MAPPEGGILDPATVPEGVWQCVWMYTRQLLYREEGAVLANMARMMACACSTTEKLWSAALSSQRRTFYIVRDVRSSWRDTVPVVETSVYVYESVHVERSSQADESYVLPNEYLSCRQYIGGGIGMDGIGAVVIPSVTGSSFLAVTYAEATSGSGSSVSAPWVSGVEFAVSPDGGLRALRRWNHDGELMCAAWLAGAGYAVIGWRVGYEDVTISVGEAREVLPGSGWTRGDRSVVGCCCISCTELPGQGGWKGDIMVVSRRRYDRDRSSCLDVKFIAYEYVEATSELRVSVVDEGAYVINVEGGESPEFLARLDAAKALQIVTARSPSIDDRASIDVSLGLICGSGPALGGGGYGSDVTVDCVLRVRGRGRNKSNNTKDVYGMRLPTRQLDRAHMGPVKICNFSPDVRDAKNRRPTCSLSQATQANPVPRGSGCVNVTFANLEQWQDTRVCARGVSVARNRPRVPLPQDRRGTSVAACLHRDRMHRFACMLVTNEMLRVDAVKSSQLVANGPKGHHRVASQNDVNAMFAICGGRAGECPARQHVWEVEHRDGRVLLSSDVLGMGDLIQVRSKQTRSLSIPGPCNPINAA